MLSESSVTRPGYLCLGNDSQLLGTKASGFVRHLDDRLANSSKKNGLPKSWDMEDQWDSASPC